MPHAHNVWIDARLPGGAPPTIQTPWSAIAVPANYTLTHIYAIAFDPMIDQMDRWARALASAPTPDFSFNPARLSRQVACLNVVVQEFGSAFELKWVFKGNLLHKNPQISNNTKCPFDIAILAVNPAGQAIGLQNGQSNAMLSVDIRNNIGDIINVVTDRDLDNLVSFIAQHPSCFPNCNPGDRDKYIGATPYFLKDRGVLVDGASSGKGMRIDIPDFSISMPWGATEKVTIRFLLR
jgi:hypothetical protein